IGRFDSAQYAKDIEQFASLKKTDLVEYALEVYEAFYWNVHLPVQEGPLRDEASKTREAIRTNRNPEYVRVVRALVANAEQAEPDPKILISEALRIMEPALGTAGSDDMRTIYEARRRLGLPDEQV